MLILQNPDCCRTFKNKQVRPIAIKVKLSAIFRLLSEFFIVAFRERIKSHVAKKGI